MPLFFFGQDEGEATAPPEIQAAVLDHASRDDYLCEQVARIFEHQVSPYEVFPVPKVLQRTLGTALKGRLSVIPEFLKMGKRGLQVQKELSYRRKLLAEVDAVGA